MAKKAGPSFASFWTQFFPPKPKFTEKNVPDLKGKVYIVTGSNTGMGKELARMLYAKNARVYIAVRSEDKARKAIEDIKRATAGSGSASTGDLIFLPLDLSDLNKVKAAAQAFLSREQTLHVLFNNAGVMGSSAKPPLRTAQGYEITLGVNCVGTFLFTRLLTPALAAAAKSEPANTVRVVWLSSFGLELYARDGVGVGLDYCRESSSTPGAVAVADHMARYGISKAGDWALAAEYARRHRADGIVSVAVNPGNIGSDLTRDQARLIRVMITPVTYPVINGAYTELFAGFSPEVTTELENKWVIPFGRLYPIRADLHKATLREGEEGGTGGTYTFWEWNEEQVKDYL